VPGEEGGDDVNMEMEDMQAHHVLFHPPAHPPFACVRVVSCRVACVCCELRCDGCAARHVAGH
jgi:hypothetical protein